MRYIPFIFILLAFISCKKEYNTDPNQLSAVEKENFKYSISRYINKPPKRATSENRFDSVFEEEYRLMAQKNDLLHYYKDNETGTVYFAIAKIAPSLKLKKVATIGKLKYGGGKEITEYEEAFRTWKMEEEELKIKTAMLFEKYINGDDVTQYYTKNSNGEFYIEFPDELTYYDKASRSWKTK